MHATELPKPFHGEGWVYEEKYDGWRMVAEKADSRVTLTSRNALDHTKRFPELAKAVEGRTRPRSSSMNHRASVLESSS
jgi:bifunctional non-homologous end joining protein LigD